MATKWALLVGIDNYLNIPRLRFAAADAQLLARTLEETCGFVVAVITDQNNPSGGGLTNREIVRALTKFIDQVDPEDTFLFYFAGHGATSEGSTYLLGTDVEENSHLARLGGLRLEDVEAIFADIRGRQKILICDCCRANMDQAQAATQTGGRSLVSWAFNDPARFEETARRIRKRSDHLLLDQSKVQIVLACASGELSYESPDLKHGVFTDAFAKALRQPVIGSGGEIVLGNVVESVRRQLDQWAARQPALRMNPLSITHDRIILGFYQGNGAMTTPDLVREHRGERVDIRLSYGDLLSARQELLKPPERNPEEDRQLQDIEMRIAHQRPFIFTTGKRAENLLEWMQLLTQQEDPATELADYLKLSNWLKISLRREDLLSAANSLYEPQAGQWRAIQDFAGLARIKDTAISQRLQARVTSEEEKIKEIEQLIGQSNLHLAQARLSEAMRLNPRSQRLRKLEQDVQPETDFKWQELIDSTKEQFERGEIAEGITRLQLAHRKKKLSAEILMRLDYYQRPLINTSEPRTMYGLEFIRVPAGALVMSDAQGRPLRPVGLSSFWISRTPISVEVFHSVMGWLPRFPPDDNPGFIYRSKPVVQVSWQDATMFCAKTNAALPTDAQWEYARRFMKDIAWPGLDEWCHDIFSRRFPEEPVLDPITDHGRNNSERVVRRWSGNRRDRFGRGPEFTAEDIGFRCVLPG